MPRKKRQISTTGVYHWIVRGINKKILFHESEDYLFFMGLMRDYKEEFDLKIYHYCLMTNHVHQLLSASEVESLSRYSHFVQRRYAYYYCKKYKWNGSVFRKGYKSIPIEKEVYLLECGRYIERNPIRAKLVKRPENYEYSSFKAYVKEREDDLIDFSPGYLGLAFDEEVRRKQYYQYVVENRVYESMIADGVVLE